MRGQNRRIVVSKAGPLYVDGVQTTKGNLPHQTKRVVSTMNRQLAHTTARGRYPNGTAEDLLGGEIDTFCEWCGLGAVGKAQVILDTETGQWWHGPEARYPGQTVTPPTCRRKWVKTHP